MTVGVRIQKLRKASGLTQGQFGAEIGVSDKAVSKWETEGGNPDMSVLNSITEFFGISFDYLMKGNIVTNGDEKAVSLIENYEKKEQKKITNSDIIQNCKRLLTENGVNILDAYLPQMRDDKTDFVNFGVFDEKDINKFSLIGLLKNGLTKVAMKHFDDKITFSNAILCDDIKIYDQALKNYNVASEKHENDYEKRKSQLLRAGMSQYLASKEKFIENDINWALEKQDNNLPNYYEVIVWLIDNGAKYCLEYEDSCADRGIYKKIVEDPSKTTFFYRVAKDMIKRNN